MTALVLDTGALIALDRDDRRAWRLLRESVAAGDIVRVPAGAIGQAWRDGRQQVLLARALRHCDEVPLDGSAARASGTLCGRAGSNDVIDASVAVTAAASSRHEPVVVLTSDPSDIGRLAASLNATVNLVRV